MDLNSSKKEWPLISIVIPFKNNQKQVLQIDRHLQNQTYPQDKMEVIYVDNASVDSVHFPKSFEERNILLEEKRYKRSPYSARNRGVEASSGHVIVFIDANSIPQKDWLEQGIRCLSEFECDLVGGNVEFDFGEKITAAKIVDSLSSIQMKQAIEERGAAYTANLFVRREVFTEIGLFEEGVRSGGDVRWSLTASEHNFKIIYCEKAVVRKFARSAKELYQKKMRTGKGYYYTWKEESQRRIWFYNLFRSLKPPSVSSIKKKNPDRYKDEFDKYKPGMWFHMYASGIVEQLSFIKEYLRSNYTGRIKK